MRRSSSWRAFKPGRARAAVPGAGAVAAAAHAVRILGLDPGSRATGFGVVDLGRDGPRYVACGAIRATGEDFPKRLQAIYAGVAALIAAYGPGEIAIERVFVNRNPDSALKLGQARGAALSATFGSRAPI